jgi:hypothetical protein
MEKKRSQKNKNIMDDCSSSRISTDSGHVRIRMNKDIYDSDCINDSVKEFSGLCDIKVSGDEVVLMSKEEDTLKIAYEFGNYVLALMKNRGLV